ncbi:hypothetical protein GTU73_08770 [Rathayibacter sp. VKM Ac-2804]|uniref:hypothetical protein n=1 Tax=Rathayibacter sp. VKM Ac-2804 TaxID=2609257 RepID=UPI00132F3261|nr:hypothetical protein [Rathayibacter sp. VKM Ac-2804]QHF24093.1 hypothetical protein GTU73_08770 [Rathayibacter sp. VKM Ac-2804]
MPTRQHIIAVAPSFLNARRNWSGKCEAAAWNLTNVLTPGYVRSFPHATSARKASRIQGPGLGPGGNWVWMSGVWGTEDGHRVDWGHVAYHVGGGLLFMASSSVTDRIPGMTALGFIDGQAYLRRFPGQKLEGWSYDHGGSIIPGDGPIVVPPPAPATPPTTPPAPPAPIDENEDTMRQFLREKTGRTHFIGKQFVKGCADDKTRGIGVYALDEPVRSLNEDDFERVLNMHGIPVEEFLKTDADPRLGWSTERGQFREVEFGALERSWIA